MLRYLLRRRATGGSGTRCSTARRGARARRRSGPPARCRRGGGSCTPRLVTARGVHDAAGDVGRVVGDEPRDHPRHVHRVEVQIRRRARGSEHGLVHAGEGTGRHRVHGDAVLATGFGERQRQRPTAAFAAPYPTAPPDSRGCRTRPPTRCSRSGRHPGDQVRRRGPGGGEPRPDEVDGQDLLELVLGDLADLPSPPRPSPALKT